MLSAHTPLGLASVQLSARLLRLPVGTRIVVTTHPLIDAAAIVPKAEDPHSEPPAGVRVVEVWQRELEYMHGPELVRAYEVRPCR